MRPVITPVIYPCKISESTTLGGQFNVIKNEVKEAEDLIDNLEYEIGNVSTPLCNITYDRSKPTIQHLKEELADIITACATLLYHLPHAEGKDVDVDISDTMRFVALKNEYRGRLEEN